MDRAFEETGKVYQAGSASVEEKSLPVGCQRYITLAFAVRLGKI